MSGEQEHDAAAGDQSALEGDGPANIPAVLLAQLVQDLGPDRVDLRTDRLDVLGAEMGVVLDIRNGHGRTVRRNVDDVDRRSWSATDCPDWRVGFQIDSRRLCFPHGTGRDLRR